MENRMEFNTAPAPERSGIFRDLLLRSKQIHLISVLVLALLWNGCAFIGTAKKDYHKSSKLLTIRNLHDISSDEVENFTQFVKNETVYVIVHPAYYRFFSKKQRSEREVHQFMLKQLKQEKEFFSYARENQQLVVLILPGRKYKKKYVRYINKITGGQDNFLYVGSKSKKSGALKKEDSRVLYDFLTHIDTKEIFVGGGYIGRCQEIVYDRLLQTFGDNSVAIDPNISSFSPSDLSPALIKMFTRDGKEIDEDVVSLFIEKNALDLLKNESNIADNIDPAASNR